MIYDLYQINRLVQGDHKKYFSSENLEEAVWQFNQLALNNNDNKDILICLVAFNDKIQKVKENKNKKHTYKKQNETKIMYRVVSATIYRKKVPTYVYKNIENLNEAADFFDQLAKSHPNILTCLCNTFDKDLSLFKYDDSDFPIFKELDKVYNKIKRNNKNKEIKNV